MVERQFCKLGVGGSSPSAGSMNFLSVKPLLDGLVEVRTSGKSCPPGYVGQAGNMSTVWFRVDGGEWELSAGRSMHQTLEVLERADTVAEFRELIR